MNKEELFKNGRADVKPLKVKGGEIYIIEPTVEDFNYLSWEDRDFHIAELKDRGIKFDGKTDKEIDEILAKNPSQLRTARMFALRFVDKDGNKQIDRNNLEDLKQVNRLDMGIIRAVLGFDEKQTKKN